MNFFKRKKLAIVTSVYWFLLLYVVAALVWWFIALQKQNEQMSGYKLEQLDIHDSRFLEKQKLIMVSQKNKTAQYIGEGSTFLLLICISAIFIYRAVRRQFRLQDQQQNFMMAVTHELKTPIAVTRLNLETLLRHDLDRPRQQKIVLAALQETERLNNLANNILLSSQLESDNRNLSKEELDLSSLIKQLGHDYSHRFPERSWQIDVEPDLAVYGDTMLLQMLGGNLIENAVKYSPKYSLVRIAVFAEQEAIFLQVADHGAGIAEKDKVRIFEKFFRAGNESTRTAQGTGLGLYLCKQIAADHKAQITVANNKPSGSIFTVRFIPYTA